MQRTPSRHGPRTARGTVLFVALVLLLLAGLLTLFALKIGMFEQRSTGNDMRSKVVIEVARCCAISAMLSGDARRSTVMGSNASTT